jgi:CelD/BcsL family acetyltransferase involved in cellulose biosynthesis
MINYRHLQVHASRDFSGLPVDGSTWNALVMGSETNTVFQTYEWLASWWKVFHARKELLVLTVRHEATLVGLAPFMVDASGGKHVLRFASDSNADYCDIIASRQYKQPVLDAIFEHLVNGREAWDKIILNNVPAGSSTIPLLSQLCLRHRLWRLLHHHTDCPALMIHGRQSEASMVLQKQSLKRPYHYFQSQAQLDFRDLTTLAEAHAYLPRFFDQHINRWKDTGSPSLFLNPLTRQFYAELLEHLWPKGWLVFSLVESGGQPIAFHYGFEYDGCFLWYKPSFDVVHRKHSPGNLLLRFLVKRAIDRGCREFDFTIGDEPFKRRYSNVMRRNITLQIYRKRPAFLWAWCGRQFKNLAKLFLAKMLRPGRSHR